MIAAATGPADPLPPPVRRLFAALTHAGGPQAATEQSAAGRQRWVSGEAGRERHGTRVRFLLRLDRDRLLEVRYRAYGCPHTLAACEWLSQQLETAGRDRADPRGERIGGPADWAAALQIPPAKLGRLLVVEDALKAALEAADKTMTDW
jgi:NifU-like protein involved in Fe-S cluster formation